jgi:hypothetical protein
VNKEKSVYLPREFLEKLVRNDLRPPLVLTGMAKKGEDDDKQVWFAIGTNCANWRVVPLNLVESIEALEIVPCRDHTHPLVKMYFKKPNSEDSMLFTSLAIDIIRAARDAVVKVLEHVALGALETAEFKALKISLLAWIGALGFVHPSPSHNSTKESAERFGSLRWRSRSNSSVLLDSYDQIQNPLWLS